MRKFFLLSIILCIFASCNQFNTTAFVAEFGNGTKYIIHDSYYPLDSSIYKVGDYVTINDNEFIVPYNASYSSRQKVKIVKLLKK